MAAPVCCPWFRMAQPHPPRGFPPAPVPSSPGCRMRGLAWVTDDAKASGCQRTQVPTGPGLARGCRGVPGVLSGLRDITPLPASSSASTLGMEVMMEAGRDSGALLGVTSPAPLAGTRPPCVRDRAVLCLFQDSPIPNLTLSQDTERMAWTTG